MCRLLNGCAGRPFESRKTRQLIHCIRRDRHCWPGRSWPVDLRRGLNSARMSHRDCDRSTGRARCEAQTWKLGRAGRSFGFGSHLPARFFLSAAGGLSNNNCAGHEHHPFAMSRHTGVQKSAGRTLRWREQNLFSQTNATSHSCSARCICRCGPAFPAFAALDVHCSRS
jgi:hypothetical protein